MPKLKSGKNVAHMKKHRAGSAPAAFIITDGDDYIIRTGTGTNNCMKLYADRDHALQALSLCREFRDAQVGDKFKLWSVPLWLLEVPTVEVTKKLPKNWREQEVGDE